MYIFNETQYVTFAKRHLNHPVVTLNCSQPAVSLQSINLWKLSYGLRSSIGG